MDATLRDLDRIQERDDDGPARRLLLIGLSGLVALGTIFTIGLVVGRDGKPRSLPAEDPLARLDRAAGLIATPDTTSADAPKVERESLVFPEVLTEVDSRPEVEAALASAAAEQAHPPPADLGAPQPSEPSVPVPTPDVAPPSAPVPASIAANPETRRLPTRAQHDPMLASALPSGPVILKAPRGNDGAFTLQVISYEASEPAQSFAASLQARGHRAFVVRADVEGRGLYYRVRVGPFSTLAEAESYRKDFERRERMNTIVVKRDSQGGAVRGNAAEAERIRVSRRRKAG